MFERYKSIIDDWEGFRAALERPLPTCVWANELRTTCGELENWFERTGTDWEPIDWAPGAYRLPAEQQPGNRIEYMGGLYHVQEEVSLLPPFLMAPEPGERILDLCAAPGNKTAQLAVALENRGTVVANDRDINRLKALRRTLDRLGVLNVSVVKYDGANMPSAVGTFDRVLVDAPCSCEGTTRKRADGWEPEAGGWDDGLAGVQRALLRRGIRLCRPGGLVAYATCTYAPEENESVVEDVIADLSDRLDLTLTLEPARIDGLVSSPGITEWQGRSFGDGMSRAMRIWPHQNDTGGFFVALIRKGESS